MEGVMIIREEDIGLYKCTKRQRNSVEMATSMTDALELREGQAEDMYNAAFKALLASSNDEQDERFIEDMQSLMIDIMNAHLLQNTDPELVAYAKETGVACRDVVAKCATKLTQMKRRKNANNDHQLEKVKEINNTASIFARLFTELSAIAPKAGELAMLMKTVCNPPISFKVGKFAKIKLVKAQIMDDLKYNRYDDIASTAVSVYDDLEAEDHAFYSKHLGLIIEQIIQKLFRTIPTHQCKLSSPGVQNIRQFITSLLDRKDMPLQEMHRKQMSNILMVLKHDDKTILPSDVLESIKSILECSGESPDERMYHTVLTLPQGENLLNESQALAKRRMASESSLLELGEVSKEINDLETAGESNNVDVEKLVLLWTRTNKLQNDLKDKPEISNVSQLLEKLAGLGEAAINIHVASEFTSFINSQVVHSKNNMKCLQIPGWKVLALRPHLPNHDVFRHHETLQSCCNALDVSKQRVDGGDDSTNSNLSLKKSHSLMDAWTNTHNQITNVYKDNTTLIEALFNFKEHFFHVMQNGFNDKAHTLEVTLQASLHKSMDEAPATSDQSWNSMRIALDDYMRLSTAEVFDADQKASMSKFKENEECMKISTKPSKETSDALTALANLKSALEKAKAHDHLVKSLEEIGVCRDIPATIDQVESSYHLWVGQLQKKIQDYANNMVKSLKGLKLPQYDATMSAADASKEMLKCQCLPSATDLIAKLKSFVAAAKTTGDMATVSIDLADAQSTLADGKNFVYTYTLLTILQSQTWKSVTPESAKKSESRFAEIVKNLQYTLNTASSEGVVFPGELQSQASDKLKQAGVSV
ncbi:unnamed protein product [Durusdinium trenchii]|uniref:Uncharacterized protein n=1 Tax=Durusdinium trenchii TaxID=1381693 RepID=A0ABP0Q654_9DINO